MFIVVFAIMFAGMAIRNNAQFIPDVASGNLAAAKLFSILDETD